MEWDGDREQGSSAWDDEAVGTMSPRVFLPAAGGTPGPTVPVALGGGGGGTALLERGQEGSVMD